MKDNIPFPERSAEDNNTVERLAKESADKYLTWSNPRLRYSLFFGLSAEIRLKNLLKRRKNGSVG